MQYIVVSRKSEDDIEDYETGNTNVIEFKALDYQGNYIYNMAELHIVFGANAVEGLGNELLRCYISGKKLMEYVFKNLMRTIYLKVWEYVFYPKVLILFLWKRI